MNMPLADTIRILHASIEQALVGKPEVVRLAIVALLALDDEAALVSRLADAL